MLSNWTKCSLQILCRNSSDPLASALLMAHIGSLWFLLAGTTTWFLSFRGSAGSGKGKSSWRSSSSRVSSAERALPLLHHSFALLHKWAGSPRFLLSPVISEHRGGFYWWSENIWKYPYLVNTDMSQLYTIHFNWNQFNAPNSSFFCPLLIRRVSLFLK